MRRSVSKIIIAVIVIAAAAAVLYKPRPSPVGTTAESAAVGRKTLRVGIVTLPADRGYPWNTTGVPNIFTHRAMFDGLTYVTAEGKVEPFLATSWQQVDPLTWRFKLRDGVKFQNGVPFTADAVVFAVTHLTRPGGEIDLTARELSGLKSAEAEDAHSVLIHTKRPEPLLPAALELLAMVEPGQFQRLGREGFSAQPIGTGPFTLVRWNPAGADFVAFKDSWRAPKVDALELIEMPEIAARVQGVLAGRVDVAVSLGYEEVKAIQAAGGGMNATLDSGVLGVVFVLTKIPKDHPLQDRRVRQALNYAVDKDSYIKALYGGFSRAASQPAVASSFGFNADVKPYPYDPDRARAMLKEAGYANGFAFTADVPVGGGASLAEAYQLVASDLAKVGVAMTIRAISVPQLNRGVLQGEWTNEAFGTNYGAQRTTDALRAMRLHSCLHPNPWYCNQQIQPAIAAAQNEGDLDTRRRLTEQIMATYHEEAPAIWMHEIPIFEGLGAGVRNLRNDFNVIRYDLIELANDK